LGSVSAAALTTPFRNTVAFGIERLNAESPEQAAGLFLYSQGIKSERLAEKVNASGVLTGKEKESLLRSVETTKNLEEAYPQRSSLIFSAFREPEIQIAEYAPAPPSGVQQISFQRGPSGPVLSSENFSLGPVGSFVQQRVGGFAEKQVNKVVDKAGKKVAEKVAKKAAGKGVQKAVETGAKAAAGTAAKAGAEGIAAALGLPAGGVGAVITWLLIKAAELLLSLLKKILRPVLDWLRENKEAVLASLVGAGVFFGSPVLIGIGVAGFGVLGISAVSATISAAVAAFYLFVTGFFIPRILVPIIYGLLAFTLLVIFILFIINSGSYVVPLSPYLYTPGAVVENPYIGVEKTAEPPGPFQNSQLPLTITYTITVTAKLSTLTNIRFNYDCEVIRSGAAPNCPSTNPSIPAPPISISPVQPFTFTYRQTFSGSNFRDSLVVDTFTVTADTPGAQNAEAAASAGIKIGNPPDTCPNGWPILPYASEGSLVISQGPRGIYTHRVIEAIDIQASVGHSVTARHSGIAQAGPGGNYGTSVRIVSNCGGRSFSSIYGHLSTIAVPLGQSVVMGQTIGLSGISGTDNAHLHYEFSPSTSGVPMAPPYIPKSVPYGCHMNCGVSVP